MTTFLQVIILIAVASIAILVFYLIDRVNSLQRYTRLLQTNVDATGDPAASAFGGLGGEKLWDAVSGVPIEGWDTNSIDLVRNRYQMVLRKHVEDLFLKGFQNAQAGIQTLPSSAYTVQTLRGPVESWIPIESAIAIHKAGSDRAKCADDGLPKIRGALDEAALALFSMAGINLPRPLSEHLIPYTDAEQARLAAAATQSLALAPNAGHAGEPQPLAGQPAPNPAAPVLAPPGAPATGPAAAAQPAQGAGTVVADTPGGKAAPHRN